MKRINIGWTWFALFFLGVTGCNRATLRVPGASTDFPETATHYVAKKKLPYRLVIELPSDSRAQHYGEKVAGTRWKACSTDALWARNAPQMIQDRLVQEFSSSELFAEVTTNQARPGDFVLKTDIQAFCSQAVGFLYDRVAGMSALQVTVERDGKTLLDQKFEKVVTDVDSDYTGSQVTFIEQAMRVTMADSLRVLMKQLLQQCEASDGAWSLNNHQPDKAMQATAAVPQIFL